MHKNSHIKYCMKIKIKTLILIVYYYLGQLFCNVTTNEDSLEVNPEVLDNHPVLNDLRRVGQVLHPCLDLSLERSVESEIKHSN